MLEFLFDFLETADACVWPAGIHVNTAYRPTATDRKKIRKKINIAPNFPIFRWSMYNCRPHLGGGRCLNFLFDYYETGGACKLC